ncbi:MAG: DNA-3-methyladenine glycosylase 2 family protein [Bacteroidota bacterium]|nr:DNA-3-methyladenine glycosylase 2 family protein [Bacteroidota bacterium]
MTWDISAAYKLLQKDPVMKSIIKKTGKLESVKNRNLYFSLLKSITSQQLSTKAGDTIFSRFLDLFPARKPLAEKVISMNIEKLRGAGLSYAKAGYLKNIAEFSLTHGLEYRKLNKMEDDAVMEYLISIKGVGRWTAEMILMFTVNRPDILPVDDIGIRNEMKKMYGISGEGKIFIAQMHEVAEHWKPYRTLACRHLWRHRDQ